MSEFDRHAASYKESVDSSITVSGESVEYFSEMKAVYLARRLGRSFSGKLLDYGCGVGLLAGFVAEHLRSCQIHGFDPSSDSVDRVPEATARRGRFTASVDELDNDYDAVVVANVMHHVPPSKRPAVFADLAGRLAKAGQLVVIEHNPLNPLTRWAVSHCVFDADAVLLHPGEVRRHVRTAGLRTRRLDYVVFFPRALHFLRFLEPRLGWCPAGAQYVLTAVRA